MQRPHRDPPDGDARRAGQVAPRVVDGERRGAQLGLQHRRVEREVERLPLTHPLSRSPRLQQREGVGEGEGERETCGDRENEVSRGEGEEGVGRMEGREGC